LGQFFLIVQIAKNSLKNFLHIKKQKGLKKYSYCFYELIPLAPLSVFALTSVSWQPLAS
jgi:hypothetical protein